MSIQQTDTSDHFDQEKGLLSRLGQVAEKHRQLLGLTYAQVSDRSGLSAVQISELEAGDWDIDVLSLHSLSRSLNTTAALILLETDADVQLVHP